MTHGNEGAETIAAVLSTVFEPLAEMVYAHGGFIAGFAGDAFKAVFPLAGNGSTDDVPGQAITAAWQIREHMRHHHAHETRFGVFDFNVTISIADGHVNWGILTDGKADHERRGEQRDPLQRAAFFFEGDALSQALTLDPYAESGQLILTPALAARLDPVRMQVERKEQFVRVIALNLPGG